MQRSKHFRQPPHLSRRVDGLHGPLQQHSQFASTGCGLWPSADVRVHAGVVIQGDTVVEAAAPTESVLSSGTYTGTVRVESKALEPASAK